MSAPSKLPPDAILAMAVRQAKHDADIERIAAMSDEEVERELADAQRGKRVPGPAPARRRTPWALIAAAVLLFVLIAVAAVILRGERSGDHQIRPDDTPAPSSAPSSAPRAPDQQEADRVRLIALQACTAETWGACKEGLDRARALDPAGETDPRVVAARKALASAAQHDKTPR